MRIRRLIESANRVAETIKGEETRFAHTLDIGLKRLEAISRSQSAENIRADMLKSPEGTRLTN